MTVIIILHSDNRLSVGLVHKVYVRLDQDFKCDLQQESIFKMNNAIRQKSVTETYGFMTLAGFGLETVPPTK